MISLNKYEKKVYYSTISSLLRKSDIELYGLLNIIREKRKKKESNITDEQFKKIVSFLGGVIKIKEGLK